MVKFRVKRISNVGIMTETFSTECVKESTAINRFTRILSEYDDCFTESMLSAFMSLSPVGYSNGLLSCRAIVCTYEYTLTVFNCGTEWVMLIEFKNTDSKTDNKESDSKTDNKESDSKTDNKESDNKGYMNCEYFFSLDPKLPPKCKHCIYSERDFCPADGEKYWGICEE